MARSKNDRSNATAVFFDSIRPPASPGEKKFRHSHWEARRQKIIKNMAAAGANVFQLAHFEECGGDAVVEWSEIEQRYRVRANYCHSRHCEPCMRSKANLIGTNLCRKITDQAHLQHRFSTFTLKHSTAPLADQIRRLYKSFKSLRATPLWKKTQVGGCFMLEVKWNGKSWHPHLHVISNGRFMPQDQLAGLWHQITGDSMIVDIRLLTDAREAAFYCVKYITKSTSPSVWDNDDAAQEWLTASKGVRCCATFGSWRKFRLLARGPDPKDWVRVDTLDGLLRRVQAGEVHAMNLFLILRPPGLADSS